jgi:hypothetical protein
MTAASFDGAPTSSRLLPLTCVNPNPDLFRSPFRPDRFRRQAASLDLCNRSRIFGTCYCLTWSRIFVRKARDRMRAALFLVGLGTLVVMELETPPRTRKPVSEPPALTTVGLAVSRDTLTEADRFEIPPMQQQAPAQLISSIEPATPPAEAATAAREPAKPVEPKLHRTTARRPAVMLPKPRPRHTPPRATASTGRSRPMVEVKSCTPGAFDGLLKALNLSTGCQT